ncbi:hypothetical protein OPT79_64 [Klebsiella phage vB_KpnD_Opt-79]|uniref:Uncharacterized protein n=1 Tax=Escherichia phage vB_EcoD_Sadiya TaxID=2902684 RepID=A0AC61TRN1_9CAUD|nr:hypothetical protein OPT79_64 [Klebsiella phage vB_KpnD_Opt-79]UGV22753.1 hypothetical protein SADIYA_64 [Escherichia phage vB_EcoD_Sadiya]
MNVASIIYTFNSVIARYAKLLHADASHIKAVIAVMVC